MFTLASRKMSRAAIVAALTLAGSAGAFLAGHRGQVNAGPWDEEDS